MGTSRRRITIDQYEEELDRWVRRAKIQRRHLVTGSEEERQLSRAIRRMEVAQLRCRIQRTERRLHELPRGSDERRRLTLALDAMAEEYAAERNEIDALLYETHARVPDADRGGALAEARNALERASSCLRHPPSEPALREAIADIEFALGRLHEEVRQR